MATPSPYLKFPAQASTPRFAFSNADLPVLTVAMIGAVVGYAVLPAQAELAALPGWGPASTSVALVWYGFVLAMGVLAWTIAREERIKRDHRGIVLTMLTIQGLLVLGWALSAFGPDRMGMAAMLIGAAAFVALIVALLCTAVSRLAGTLASGAFLAIAVGWLATLWLWIVV